jgi:hypothetical protein
MNTSTEISTPILLRKWLSYPAKYPKNTTRGWRFSDPKGGVMLVWCAVLLFLGITAFLDSIFTFGEIFRKVNSVLFMLVSLGLLIRTSTKIRLAQRENTQEKIQQLEARVAELTGSEPHKEKVATPS